MKTRRHHNKHARRQLKTGSYLKPVKKLQRELAKAKKKGAPP